nr:hypothetical protein [Streptobacillus moniliformis]
MESVRKNLLFKAGFSFVRVASLSAEYYVKNDSKTEFGYENAFTKKASTELNWGGIFGKNKEVFTFVGGEVNLDKDTNFGGEILLGINVKKAITKDIGLILNAAYQYNDKAMNKKAFEENIREVLKSRGEWKEEIEKDKYKLKRYYRGQGLRFKGEETLFSGVVDYNHKLFKLQSGVIYTAGYAANSNNRLESFLNLKTNKSNYDIELDIDHKFKYERPDTNKDNGTYSKGGRLNIELSARGNVGNLNTYNKGIVYLGTIIPSKKDYQITSENEVKYTINNIELSTAFNNKLAFRQVEKINPDKLKIRLQPELKLGLKYANKNIDFETNGLIKGRVDLKKEQSKKIEIEGDEYTKDNNVTNNNTDIKRAISNIYVDSRAGYKLGVFNFRLAGRYVGVVSLKEKSKDIDAYNQYAFVGPGITYESKVKELKLKHSFDIRYEIGYKDKKTFSVINFWSDNRQEYKVNDKLSLKGEVNFTSSNRFSFIDKNSDKNEILLLADTKGTVEYKLNNKTDLTSTLGLKTISLFKEHNNNNGGNMNKHGDESLHLDVKYAFKVSNENKVTYQLNNNIDIVGRIDTSFAYGLKSDKLYESLTMIKRERIGEDGIITHTEGDLKKIKEDEASFGENRAILLISPSAELSLKYLNDKLHVKPSLGVDVSAKVAKNQSKLEYKEVNVKARLQVEYRW